jgi:hypothetical protein
MTGMTLKVVKAKYFRIDKKTTIRKLGPIYEAGLNRNIL